MDNTINWKQVLEIETFLNNYLEENYILENWLWRNQQDSNIGILTNKSKQYSHEDLRNYLLSKYPKDELIKHDATLTNKLFEMSLDGKKLCEIDKQLYEINEKQDQFKLTKESIKNNYLAKCAEYIESTSFFINFLKYVIDTEYNGKSITSLDDGLMSDIEKSYIKYVNEFIKNNYRNLELTKESCNIDFPVLLIDSFKKLILNAEECLTGWRFTSYVKSCTKNNYSQPYKETDKEIFTEDIIKFSIAETLNILKENSKKYFSFKLKKNDSPYPQDLINSQYGKLEIYVTLYGLLNFKKIEELSNNRELLHYINEVLSEEFEIFDKEIDYNDFNLHEQIIDYISKSPIIVSKDLVRKSFYNEYSDSYENKVIKGNSWFNSSIKEVSHTYLIMYLERADWDREIDEILEENGYWNSKEEYENEVAGD